MQTIIIGRRPIFPAYPVSGKLVYALPSYRFCRFVTIISHAVLWHPKTGPVGHYSCGEVWISCSPHGFESNRNATTSSWGSGCEKVYNEATLRLKKIYARKKRPESRRWPYCKWSGETLVNLDDLGFSLCTKIFFEYFIFIYTLQIEPMTGFKSTLVFPGVLSRCSHFNTMKPSYGGQLGLQKNW